MLEWGLGILFFVYSNPRNDAGNYYSGFYNYALPTLTTIPRLLWIEAPLPAGSTDTWLQMHRQAVGVWSFQVWQVRLPL